jgi:hypothetical protein
MSKDNAFEDIIGDEVPQSGFEVMSFYEGTITLVYDKALHAYYRETPAGERIMVSGVTSITGMVDKSAALTQWAANETTNYLRHKLFVGPEDVVSLTGNQLLTMLDEARYNFKLIQKLALDTGKIAHSWLECKIKAMMENLAFNANLPEDEKAANCIKAAVEWMDKHHFAPIESERKIYSREYDYSGTLDWVAFIQACGGPMCCPFTEGRILRVLGDFKSSKRLYDDMRLQLGAYKYARQEEIPDQPIEACVILRLGKEDGAFEPMWLADEEDYEADFQGFLGAMGTYNWMRQIGLQRRYIAAKKRALVAAAKKKAPRKPKVTHHLAAEEVHAA